MSVNKPGVWPEIGARVAVGIAVIGIVAEIHPVNFWVRLHLLSGLKDHGTTAWFEADLCEVIE